jgi:pimeloyl-ACP methyl ester carboxylesterase
MRKRNLAIAGVAGLAGAVLGVFGLRAGAQEVIARQSRGRMRSRWVRVNGRRIHMRVPAERASPGTVPVVLLHGAVIGSSYMIPLAVRLAPEFPVFAPDLPGHEGSEAAPRALEIEELADTLTAWLDAIGLERAALVGHSLGSQVAAHVAARHPERVDRLVLIGPTSDPDARTSREQLLRLARDGRHEPASLWLLESDAYLRAGLRLPHAELRMSIDDHLEDTLARVSTPTMVVFGGDDPLVSPQWAEEVARAARAAPPVVIPGAGHAVHHSAPDAVARAIRPFLLEGRPEPEAWAVAMEMQ